MKKVLITGINGFLGSHLAKSLSKEFEIIGLVRSQEQINSNDFLNYAWEEDNHEKIFSEQNIYAVVHCATVYRVPENTIVRMIDSNIIMPVRLLELCENYSVELFLNTDTFYNTSGKQYGYLSEYALSKKQVLEWLKIISKKCKLVNMKLYHVYGEGDSEFKFIPSVLKKIVNNEVRIDLTSGEQRRDFVYIDDVVSAYEKILTLNISDIGIEYEVGTGHSTSIKELLTLMKQITKSESELNFGAIPNRVNEFEEIIAENSALKKLGWVSEVSLESGLKNMIEKMKLN